MALRRSELSVGQEFAEVVVEDLTRTQIVMYAGASGDYNPIHTDEVFATQVAGYPTVFAHGMLTMGMTGRVLTDLVGDGRLADYGVRFKAQVWPGDTLTATATVTDLRVEEGRDLVELSVVTTNADGQTVLEGTASAWIDP